MRPPFTIWYRVSVFVVLLASAIYCLAQVEPTVWFQGKPIRFARAERPYYSGRTAMMPLRTVCLAIGAGVRRSKDGKQWTIMRGTDRLDCSSATNWFTFNGVRQPIPVSPQARGSLLFVPFELIQTMSAGNLEVKADLDSDGDAAVFYGDHVLEFKADEAPFRQAGTTFVSVRATAAAIGAKVSVSNDGIRLTITRSRDRIQFDQRFRWYTFNGAQRTLRSESIVRRKTIFVPIELLQAFVGDELQGR